ncbi:hypothetical protein Tco_0392456 [Tanacetum coccineum]
MDNLDKKLNKEILHEKDSKSALSVIKVQFDKFFHSEVLKPSNYDGEKIRNIFNEYTRMEPQSFKDVIIQYMESIENCIDEGALQKRLKSTERSGTVSHKRKKKFCNSLENDCCKTRNDQISGNQSSTSRNESSRSGIRLGNECSERRNSRNDMDISPSYDTKPMAEVPNSTDYNVLAIEKQHIMQPEFIKYTYVMEKNDSNITFDSSDMSHNVRKVDQHATKHENERVLVASSIEKLKANIEANKEIQKDLQKVNTSLTKEHDKYKLDMQYCKINIERTRPALVKAVLGSDGGGEAWWW